MFIIKYKKIFIAISISLVVISIVILSTVGLTFGIDFRGGALTEVYYENVRPEILQIQENIDGLSLGVALVQPTGENGFIIKTRSLSDLERQAVLKSLSQRDSIAVEKSFSSIGPSVGNELTRKAVTALILVVLVIICFIAYAFRKVGEQVSSWKYGLIAVGALLHDVILASGVFSILGYFFGAEVDSLFVVAILTVLGLSVSDTIVVFDRIRENLALNKDKKISFSDTVGQSLGQVYTRSINTSLTVIVVLLALFFLGPESTRYFAFMMTAGMFFGTYSSIFLASPLLVVWENYSSRKKAKLLVK